MELKKIHADDRGEIYILTGLVVFPEVTCFRTKDGYARGGCIHNINSENICVIEGEIVYVWGENKREKLLVAGESMTIEKGTPHYYFSETDSLVLEWGATPEEKIEKHKEFREIVDNINKNRKVR